MGAGTAIGAEPPGTLTGTKVGEGEGTGLGEPSPSAARELALALVLAFDDWRSFRAKSSASWIPKRR